MSDARDEIIYLFEKGILPHKDNAFKTTEQDSEENKLEKIKDDYKTFLEYTEGESKSISYELFKKHFNFVSPVFTKQLYKIKDKKENNELVNVIKSGKIDLKDEIIKMSKDEIKIEKPHKILKIVEEILNFNNKIQKQQDLGLENLTRNQILTRLTITLAHLKAGNNSEKLKNEIRHYILCTNQKNLQNNYIKVWSTLFKNGNNLYEH